MVAGWRIGIDAAFKPGECFGQQRQTRRRRIELTICQLVTDLVVVAANGRVLVMDRARAADLKKCIDALPAEIREIPP